ncbi:hypothetical protein [Streptomyces mirabilis]|uniref:hypothetical protein n=1 Tax=Streptomyces mirabilis TaxID=68239 RepID=UPI0021C04419|nr:hypothetical protein [Streptomyces mirabilis]MCT9105320.1 hypothetical protein [Streptomyces mirabilis]
MSSTPAVIEMTATDLHTHPAVDEMARDLLKATPAMLATLIRPDDSPSVWFMGQANERFRERAGTSGGPFLGSVARAVITRLAELRAEQGRAAD